MSWHLGGSLIPEPSGKVFKDSIQIVSHRTLGGKYVQHYLGQSKKVITLSWDAISQADFNTIEGHRIDQVLNTSKKLLVIDELGFSAYVSIIGDVADYDIPRTYTYLKYGLTLYEQ